MWVHQIGIEKDAKWLSFINSNSNNTNIKYQLWTLDQTRKLISEYFPQIETFWEKLSVTSQLSISSWIVVYVYGGWFMDEHTYVDENIGLELWKEINECQPVHMILEPAASSISSMIFSSLITLRLPTTTSNIPFVQCHGWYAPAKHILLHQILTELPLRYNLLSNNTNPTFQNMVTLTGECAFQEYADRFANEIYVPETCFLTTIASNFPTTSFSIQKHSNTLLEEELAYLLPFLVLFIVICLYFNKLIFTLLCLLGMFFMMIIDPGHLWIPLIFTCISSLFIISSFKSGTFILDWFL
jgi:hypothetical protein